MPQSFPGPTDLCELHPSNSSGCFLWGGHLKISDISLRDQLPASRCPGEGRVSRHTAAQHLHLGSWRGIISYSDTALPFPHLFLLFCELKPHLSCEACAFPVPFQPQVYLVSQASRHLVLQGVPGAEPPRLCGDMCLGRAEKMPYINPGISCKERCSSRKNR